MTCRNSWAYKAKNRRLKIQIEAAEGSNPAVVDLGFRTVDLGEPPEPTTLTHFGADQLADGVEVALRPNRRYEMPLIVAGPDQSVVVSMGFDDGTVLVPDQTCTRNQWPITGRWTLTTWREA